MWQPVGTNGLGQTCCHLQLMWLSWAGSLIFYYFSPQMFHAPGISNILGSPLQLRIHPHSLPQSPLRVSVQWIQSCHISAGLLGLHLKSQWKASSPCNSCILRACKPSLSWMTLRSASSSSSSGCPCSTTSLSSECLGGRLRKHFHWWPWVSC
jgi:hypothetical protein